MFENEIPLPPWLQFPDVPAGDIKWRMGDGEDYLKEFWSWADQVSQNERRRYILQYCPIPDEWVLWAVEVYAYPNDNEAAFDAAWAAVSDDGDG